MKRSILTALLMAVVFFAISVSPAMAASKSRREPISVSNAVTSGSTVAPPCLRRVSWHSQQAKAAGLPRHLARTGSASRTFCRGWVYDPVVTVITKSYWNWSKGSVTYHSWDDPKITVDWGAAGTSVTWTISYGQRGWRPWHGKAHGEWFQSVSIHFHQSVFLHSATIADWVVTDQYWLHANGTWSVWSNL